MTEAKSTLPIPAQQDFAIFDLADDEQIIAELQGKVADKLVYEFNGSDGSKQSGLSYSGVNAVCREMAKQHEAIRVQHDSIKMMVDPTDPEYVLAMIVADRFVIREDGTEIRLDNAVGVKRQWTKMELRNGKTLFDKFFAEKAISKASRNARRALIPEAMATELINLWKKNGNNRQLSGARAQAKPPRQHPAHAAPPPQSAPQAQAKKKSAKQAPAGDPLPAARQRLFATMAMATKNMGDSPRKQIWKDLTGLESSKDADLNTLQGITAALKGVVDGVNALSGDGGKYAIKRLSDGLQIYPIQQQPDATPVAESEGEDLF